jgi:NADH:ubiquinone oxidoreductase subunit 5 (subunit L)/multisubunit Na+/H+ antiporter MnhA subunit
MFKMGQALEAHEDHVADVPHIGVASHLGPFPPLAGFFSKDEILWSGVQRAFRSPAWLGPVLYVVALAARLDDAFYMFRAVLLTFHGTASASRARSQTPPATTSTAVDDGPARSCWRPGAGLSWLGFLERARERSAAPTHASITWLEPGVFAGHRAAAHAGRRPDLNSSSSAPRARHRCSPKRRKAGHASVVRASMLMLLVGRWSAASGHFCSRRVFLHRASPRLRTR